MMRMERLFSCDAELGEGASWDAERNGLWWVDILGKRLFFGDARTGEIQVWQRPREIGGCLPCISGRRILIERDRVSVFDPATGIEAPFWLASEEPSGNRLNDAGLDRQGNLWIGSMDFDAQAESGAVWRVTPTGKARRMRHGLRVVNGPVFSPDGRTMYVADTMEGRVDAHDHNPENGNIGPPRPIIHLGRHGGLADGMAVDAEGCIWLARITAARVTRFAPDGRALLTLPVPVPNPTSCAFGGPDLRRLCVTTARALLSPIDCAAYPDSGSVFAADVDVPGLPDVPFEWLAA